jgi:hypothetical protein
MPNHHPDTVALARSEAQRVLSMSPSFVRLSEAEQLAMYRQLVDSNLARMQSRPNGRIARGFADPPPPEPPGGLARSDIENKRFDQLPQIGADFIQQIDFPQFVKDLLQGVFDANLKVTIQQMKTYQDLLDGQQVDRAVRQGREGARSLRLSRRDAERPVFVRLRRRGRR